MHLQWIVQFRTESMTTTIIIMMETMQMVMQRIRSKTLNANNLVGRETHRLRNYSGDDDDVATPLNDDDPVEMSTKHTLEKEMSINKYVIILNGSLIEPHRSQLGSGQADTVFIGSHNNEERRQ